ncbi:MAG: hypothetical protein LCH62_20830, partial [Proteobacteria bacterium]|nr:hypothetical protein [Pseudomonadota bacterium]
MSEKMTVEEIMEIRKGLAAVPFTGWLIPADSPALRDEAARREAVETSALGRLSADREGSGVSIPEPPRDAPPADDLVARLRELNRIYEKYSAPQDAEIVSKAAAAIEALRAERDGERKRYDGLAQGFWRIVDTSIVRAGLPSDELVALATIVHRLTEAEARVAALEGAL